MQDWQKVATQLSPERHPKCSLTLNYFRSFANRLSAYSIPFDACFIDAIQTETSRFRPAASATSVHTNQHAQTTTGQRCLPKAVIRWKAGYLLCLPGSDLQASAANSRSHFPTTAESAPQRAEPDQLAVQASVPVRVGLEPT